MTASDSPWRVKLGPRHDWSRERMDDSELGHVGARVMAASRIAILGAGLNQQRTAHDAIHDLSASGWHPVPIHPSDAGGRLLAGPFGDDSPTWTDRSR